MKERTVKDIVLKELSDAKRDWFAPNDRELKEAKRLYSAAIKAVRSVQSEVKIK